MPNVTRIIVLFLSLAALGCESSSDAFIDRELDRKNAHFEKHTRFTQKFFEVND